MADDRACWQSSDVVRYGKRMIAILAMTVLPLPQVDPAALRATIEKLSSWNTRHTASDELSGPVAAYMVERFSQIPGAKVEAFRYEVKKGPRIPADRTTTLVLCRLEPNAPDPQPGLVMMGGHMDTINMSGPADVGLRAPGANDDGSGTAATLECARLMAGRPRRHPMLFVAFSGEEQGLLGAKALAAHAKDEGWTIDALLNNDMIGNSRNGAGAHDDRTLRVFSEEVEGHQGRELARWIEWLQRTEGAKGHAVRLVFRKDRFGRGGDHTPFNDAGFTAVRLTEAVEDYTHQHTPDALPESVDYPYLAKNARVNLLALDRLANAGPPPSKVRIDRKQSHDTTLAWTATPGTAYVVYWRDTASGRWEGSQKVGAVATVNLKLDKDNTEFAVGAEGGIPRSAE